MSSPTVSRNTTTTATIDRNRSQPRNTVASSPTAVFGTTRHDVPQSAFSPPVRPPYRTIPTADRLRENHRLAPLVLKMSGKIRKGRLSVFKEVGLDGDRDRSSASPSPLASPTPPQMQQSPVQRVDFQDLKELRSAKTLHDDISQSDTSTEEVTEADEPTSSPRPAQRPRQNSLPPAFQSWYSKITRPRHRPRVRSASGAPPQSISGTQRFALIVVLIAIIFPAFSIHHSQSPNMDISGVDAGVLHTRATSPTEICTRWAHQVANVNGTLYIYGGEAKTEEGQDQDTWNNNFLTLDLNTDWSTDSPALKGLERPDGPPAVALGYLFQDYNSLYLYGGQFSDSPYVDPEPESLWKYSIKDKEWLEFPNMETSEGNFSAPANEPVQRAAEGAGLSVPELGLSWYFGGHLDRATTPGWSMHIERVYLKSLLEFTHPGYTNTGVKSLAGGSGASDGGVFRNITSGGVQADEFPERADAALIFVPGWGDMGVLIGLTGGTAEAFTQDPSVLDVYDIAHSEWFRQETTGDAPSVRVNPCMVIASAPDASSFQIYLFGGQNLQPAGDQTQYNDMYILSIPAFVWVKVESNDDTPYPRAGHTCTMRDGQIVLVGGYVGEDIACDSPGIYVFDASGLEWKKEFSAGDHDADLHSDNSVLAGSYGYTVPQVIIDEIGGDEEGGATATMPAAGEPSDGPFATGKPPVFTITQSGAVTTITPTGQPDASDGDGGDDGGQPVAGLIAAGVIAGVAGTLALYLGFCAWLYRRQVSAYRQHLAVANRYSNTPGGSASMLQSSHMPPMSSLAAPGRLSLFGSHGKQRASHSRSDEDTESFGWVGSDREPGFLSEPKWTSDDPSPSGGIGGSGTSGSGSQDMSAERRHSTSGESTEGLLEGHEPSFFSVVMAPRRALRVVNGID